MSDKRPIIIIKKKAGHGGHHGGAWKVAYADFVTAMMALFIVLWLTSSGEKVRKSIAGYFNDPSGKTTQGGTDRRGAGQSLAFNRDEIHEVKKRLEAEIAQTPDLKPLANQIEIAITPEGMRIELIEDKDGTFFQSGSAVLKPMGQELLQMLAHELGSLANRISTEGHTDATAYAADTKYGNWELSTDRANAARRVMQASGLHPGQITQVRGFADQELRMPASPLDPSNRRVSVIVHYLDYSQGPPPPLFKPGEKTPAAPETGAGHSGAKAGTAAPAGQAVPKSAAPVNGKAIAGKAQTDPAAPPAAPPAAQSAAPPQPKPGVAAAPPTGGKPSAIQALLKKLPAVPSMPAMPSPHALMEKVTGMFAKKKPAMVPPSPEKK